MDVFFKGLVLFLILHLSACSSVPPQAQIEPAAEDPWHNVNRKVYAFNKVIDNALLSPASRAYAAVTPDPVEQGVENFFNNLSEIGNFANHLLQGKPAQAINDAGRLVVNSTVGVYGLFDVAAYFGMYSQAEDFGQTLGYWGVESGPYVVLPLLGPSNLRDSVSLAVDNKLDPLASYQPADHRAALQALKLLDTRYQLQDVQQLMIGDEYTFVREAYLAWRAMQIRDGAPATHGDEGFDEVDEFN